LKASKQEIPTEKRIELYKEAVELYKGDFLPLKESDEWVVDLLLKYQNIYINCVKNLYILLSNLNDYESILGILEKAVRILKYNDEIHILYIKCLIKLKKFQQAKDYYNKIADLYYNELGVDISEEFKQLYFGVADTLAEKPYDLPNVVQILQQKEKRGAYYCNFLSFVENCEIVLRATSRSNLSACLISCTLIESRKSLKKNKNETDALEILGEVIEKKLRIGDIYTKTGNNQFLIMLLGANHENCNAILERIIREFFKTYKGNDVKIEGVIMPAR